MGWETGAAQSAPASLNALDHLNRDTLLLEWKNTARDLAMLKTKELMYRNTIVAREFKDTPEGTHYIELGNGYRLKAVIRENYNLDKDNAQIEQALHLISEAGPKGRFIAERLVKWEASLSIKEWRDLDDNIKKIIGKVLTITPGTPQLELIEPKS